MSCVLGIDLGTSSVKVVLFDAESAHSMAHAQVEYPVHKPRPNEAVQSPEAWWDATVTAIQQVLEQAHGRSPVAIGLSGQMHGTVLLGRDGAVLHPAIIWADQRSAQEAHDLPLLLGEERTLQQTGTLPSAGFMGSTLYWIQRHQPSLLEHAHAFLLPKDYIRFRLTGEIGTDFTDGAGTGLLDIRQRVWATPIIEAIGLSVDRFPTLHASEQVVGTVLPSVARLLGLGDGVRVVAGVADQVAQALGNGLIHQGQVSVTVGSGGQVFAPLHLTDQRADARLHLFNHAVPNTHYALGAILSAGLSLRWLRNVLGLADHPQAYALLSDEASQVAVGADGLFFLPHLSGERTPHMDPLARGGFIGLTHYHQRGHMARAVMEGVTFALRQALELVEGLAQPSDRIVIAGGASESAVWRQIQADVFARPLQQSMLHEQTVVGASLLGGVGAGLYRNFDEAIQSVAQYDAPTLPHAPHVRAYEAHYQEFCQLYPLLRHTFARMTTPPA